MALRLGYGHVVVNGIKIHYYRTGDDKPPIILLHGALDNGLCWNRLPILLEPIYDVIMIEARGHGFSDAPDNGYHILDHSNDVLSIIQSLYIKKPILIGHSMGGNTAAFLATHHSDLIKSIILEDPPWRIGPAFDSEDERKSYITEQRNKIINFNKSGLEALIKYGQEKYPTWEDSEYFQWAKAKQQVSPNIISGIFDDQFNWEDQVKLIRCPGLLITADVTRGAITSSDVTKKVRDF